ncbi:hypothetical protein B6V01_000450 [Methanosarcinales archaeon ex4572_44]|nr:MAG: hypothetical protein B6V01_000450 [Methanosarcinales archaeon ex4572_44]
MKKILLINPSEYYETYSSLALIYLGTYLMERVDCKVEIESIWKKNLNNLHSYDLIGITSYTPEIPYVKNFAEEARDICDVPIIVGGAHASGDPVSCLNESPYFDIVNEGYGREIATIAEEKEELCNIPNITYRKNGEIKRNKMKKTKPIVQDTIPDRKIDTCKNKDRVYLLSSTGCSNFCDYCACVKDGYHLRKKESLTEEINGLNPKSLIFCDDSHITKTSIKMLDYVYKTCDVKDVRKECLIDPFFLSNNYSEVSDFIQRNSYRDLFIGVESSTYSGRDKIGRRYHGTIRDESCHKRETDGIKKFIKQFDGGLTLSYITPHPLIEKKELISDFTEMFEFLKIFRADDDRAHFINWDVLIPFPGTRVRQRYYNYIRPDERFDWESYKPSFPFLWQYKSDYVNLWMHKFTRCYRSAETFMQDLNEDEKMRFVGNHNYTILLSLSILLNKEFSELAKKIPSFDHEYCKKMEQALNRC